VRGEDGREVIGPLTEQEVLDGITSDRFGVLTRARRVGRKRWMLLGTFSPFAKPMLDIAASADEASQAPRI
jgi:hypothetical protein